MALMRLIERYIATPAVKKHFFNKSGFNRYGLYRDDMYAETPEVVEAVRRLPQNIQDARVYRIIRAGQLSLTNTVLPENEWVTFEEDEKYRYLKPYLEEIEKEKKERKTWSKSHA